MRIYWVKEEEEKLDMDGEIKQQKYGVLRQKEKGDDQVEHEPQAEQKRSPTPEEWEQSTTDFFN